jgi:hypothetical protein
VSLAFCALASSSIAEGITTNAAADSIIATAPNILTIPIVNLFIYLRIYL